MNSTLRFSVLTGCLLVVVASVALRAETRDVGAYGANSNDERNDAIAIQKALDAANAGDTVLLPAGIFLIDHTLRPQSGVKIQGKGADQTILRLNADKQTDFFDLSGALHVELADFTIDGKGNTNAHDGIFARTGGGHFIHDLRIENLGSANGPVGIHFVGADGNYTNGVSDCVISDNEIRNIGLSSEWGGGIRLSWGCSRNQVLRNVVDNTGRGGIFANDGSSDLIISSNIVTRSGRKAEKLGIEIWRDCDRVVIEDNKMDHWLSIGGANRVGVRRNIVCAPAGEVGFIGLELIGQNLVVTDNLVDGGQQIGVSVSNNASNQCQYCAYNTVRKMIQWGAQLQGDNTGARMLYFYKNKFQDMQRGNPAAIYPGADGRGFRFNGNCQQVTLDGNDISHNSAEGIELGGSRLDQISIINNTLVGNGFTAVTGNSGSDLEWIHNTVAENGNNTQWVSRGFSTRKPVAKFSCPARANSDQAIHFTNKSVAQDGSMEHVLWDFGDGAPSIQFEDTHIYRRPGTYRVTLIVWDNHGRGAIKESVITIDPDTGNK
jgi:parallel beta-helix repeat protein